MSSLLILILTPVSASDVPGPGTYNPIDTVEKYKRGAFLEKTDRFAKDPCHYFRHLAYHSLIASP